MRFGYLRFILVRLDLHLIIRSPQGLNTVGIPVKVESFLQAREMEAVKGEERTTDVVLDFHKNLQVHS